MEKSRVVSAFLLFAFVCAAEEFHPITHRRIAQVMGAAGADWLTRPERESDEHPDQALDAIGIQRGSTVADIGAGVGYFTWRLAERVGANGVVYGEDIQQPMLDLLAKNMTARHLTNVRAVLGTAEDPKLPKNSIDLVLLVDVYHEFSEPREDAGSDSGVAEAERPDCVPGISRGRSRQCRSARAQDDGESGAGGSAAGGIPVRQDD